MCMNTRRALSDGMNVNTAALNCPCDNTLRNSGVRFPALIRPGVVTAAYTLQV